MEENRYYQLTKYTRQENVPLPLLLMTLNFNLVFHYVFRGKFLKYRKFHIFTSQRCQSAD